MVKSRSQEKGILPTRKNLQNLGNEMFVSLGARRLIDETIRHSHLLDSSQMIFDGVRHEMVLNEIEGMSNYLFLIFLKADEKVRYSRHKAKDQSSDLSLQVFREIDTHPIELGTDKLEKCANIVIEASLPIQEVLSIADESVNRFLNKISS